MSIKVNGVGGTWFPLANIGEDQSYDPCQNNGIDEEKFEYDFLKSRKESREQISSCKITAAAITAAATTTGIATPMNKAQALEFGKGFEPGKEGLLLKGYSGSNGEKNENDSNPHITYIRKGDAIAFYNYKNDASGQLDWRALHTGLPTTEKDGVKWIANHWFRVGDLCENYKTY